ncbi:EpsG family protein [Bacillus sp. 1P10SD]|uniref:EpsG family protein n=1 Tax=Bacillus sp. 1P10SD TaxID=3132265 RepID=UPI0039A49AA1
MEILWINLVVVYITSFLSRYFSKPLPLDAPYIRPNKLLIFMTMLSLVLVAGLRNNIGDTFFYMHSYKIGNHDLSTMKMEGDFGFNIYQALLYKLSEDPQLLVFTSALITNIFIVYVLYCFSKKIELSLFVYITSGVYIVTMNGIRQSLAAAIIFAATRYLLNGNMKKFFLVVLLASTIHQTALIFIPIYFIVRRDAWTKTTLIILGIGVIIAFGFNQFSSLLFSAIQDTQYGHYSNFSEGGANFLRAVVSGTPLLIAFLGKEKLKKIWPKSDYIINLSLLGLVFMIIATKNWIFARFDIYFGLYSLILVSWLLNLFSKESRNLVYYCILLLYTFYFYYENVISLGLKYGSEYLKI